MTRKSLVLAVGTMLAFAHPLAAQRLAVDDSLGVFVGVSSRLLWRGLTLSDKAGVETGASVPLRGIARGLQLEVRGWTALADRNRFKEGDQYAVALQYQLPFRGVPHPASLVFRFVEYWNPDINLVGPPIDLLEFRPSRHAEEVGARAIVDVGIEALGIRTVRLELDGARQVGDRKATWLSAGASASAGTVFDRIETTHTVAAVLRAVARASDLAGPPGTPTIGFGFQALDLGLDLEHRLSGPLKSYALSTTLRLGMLARPERRGATFGWVGIRESVLIF